MKKRQRAKTTLAKLREANMEIRFLKNEAARCSRESDARAEALLKACDDNVAKAVVLLKEGRETVDRQRKSGLTGMLESASGRLILHEMFNRESGLILNLSVPAGYL